MFQYQMTLPAWQRISGILGPYLEQESEYKKNLTNHIQFPL